MSLNRRCIALGLAASAVAAPALAQSRLSPADQALVQRAVAYLEGLAEARGRFVQTDPGGRSSQGTLFLKRTGKARFAYDAPYKLLVVSNDSVVSVQDGRLSSFNSYPL